MTNHNDYNHDCDIPFIIPNARDLKERYSLEVRMFERMPRVKVLEMWGFKLDW